ncbi:hypothetical protein ID866_11393 [Astraeus odoratus]|nr:hypothetical protein ID866_11393 [Astraeus odoratus]
MFLKLWSLLTLS